MKTKLPSQGMKNAAFMVFESGVTVRLNRPDEVILAEIKY